VRSPTLLLLAALCLAPAIVPATVRADDPPPPEGPGGRRHRVHALVGGRVVPRPGELLPSATVVIRDGTIEAVGADVVPPADAQVWDARGLTIYAGLIEPYLPIDPRKKPRGGGDDEEDEDEEKDEDDTPEGPRAPRGATHENPAVRPERLVAQELSLDHDTLDDLRKAGFTAALAVPSKGVLRGQSALVVLRDGPAREQVLRARVAWHVAFEPNSAGPGKYPNSLMGAIALVRQTLLDAEHHLASQRAYASSPMGQPRPQTNVSLDALAGSLAEQLPVMFEAADGPMALRGLEVLGELDLVPWLVLGEADGGKWLDILARAGAPMTVSLNLPPAPRWDDADEAERVPLEALRRWWLAPAGPSRLERAGARFAFTTTGLADRGDWRARIRAMLARGLGADTALAALTTAPAALLRAPQLGVVAPGGIANLTITDGDLFAEGTRIVEVWCDGRRHDLVPAVAPREAIAGEWTIELEQAARVAVKLAPADGGGADELEAVFPAAPKGAPPRPARLWRDRLELSIPAALAGTPQDALVVLRVRGNLARGTYGLPVVGGGVQEREALARHAPKDEKKKPEEKPGEAEEPDEAPYLPTVPVATWAAWPPLPEAPTPAVVFRGGTVWSLGPARTFVGDVLVVDGHIAAIGTAVDAPAGALVVDCRGRHVTPGVVDCHSHSFIAGDVNEWTNSCTAECRIHDVLDAESVDLYRQLAGGVTTANQLHGSANAIGGQNAVVQLRWGSPPAALRFEGAPAGIKFALGENPRRANWGGELPPRYPTSRMGVEELIRERFLAARNYRRARDEWTAAERKELIPPRVDLQLEALAEILEGTRLVHCHSYRQDEILAMIRLAEELGFTVGTFQHALEAYKVADEIAAHGAGVSTFSDWWAYKFEVYDAIGWNGALCVQRGVLTSFNSDSSEMARRLPQEAGKAIRYGGLTPEEALALVTLAPARQLGLTERVGSLEVGRQADLVVWSGGDATGAVSALARCDETWIGGRRYFERNRDAAAQELVKAERRELVRAAASARRRDEGGDPGQWRPTFDGAARASGHAGCDDHGGSLEGR
jgi:imidazolonepropionase-like amidohydrolase